MNIINTGENRFETNCPYCESGTLQINPNCYDEETQERFCRIEAIQCEADCACPLTDAEIKTIEKATQEINNS